MAKTRKSSRARSFPLYPYQQRWLGDDSRFKIACKARQIGFTFVATLRVVLRRRHRPGLTVWLSASERQALEAMEYIRQHLRVFGLAARREESFIEGTSLKQHTVRLPNGSRIVALPANPDTVRGFAGDVVLDEFGFHRDADAIWRAAFATATRGFQLEIISTPNGARGKYYELARQAGLLDYTPEAGAESAFPKQTDDESRGAGFIAATRSSPVIPSPAKRDEGSAFSASIWSPHRVDLPTARAQGFVVDVESLRAAIGDEDAWQQEYCCRFLSDAAHYIPPELVVAAEHPAATTTPPFPAASDQWPATSEVSRRGRALALPKTMPRAAQPGKGSGENLLGFPQPASGQFYLGVDIGRRRDLTVLWLLEVENPLAPPEARVFCTRGVLTLDRQPFSQQRRTLDSLLALRGDILRLRSGQASENRNWKTENGEHKPIFPFPFSSFASSFMVRRCAVDATGLGAMLAEELEQKWGARVEPVQFTLGVKEDLAVRVKRLLEDGRLRLPYDPVVRAALGSVKRYATATGHWRFDADRTDTAGHADHFWALALALFAAVEPELSVDYISTAELRPSSQAFVF